MNYDWYKVINRAEFEALDIPSREVELILEGIGMKTVLVVRGNFVSLVYDGVMLAPGMLDRNPFAFDSYAAYEDAAGDLWLGIEVDED